MNLYTQIQLDTVGLIVCKVTCMYIHNMYIHIYIYNIHNVYMRIQYIRNRRVTSKSYKTELGKRTHREQDRDRDT